MWIFRTVKKSQQAAEKVPLSLWESVGKISLCSSQCSPCLGGASFLKTNLNTETLRSRSLHGEVRFSRQTPKGSMSFSAACYAIRSLMKRESCITCCTVCVCIYRPTSNHTANAAARLTGGQTNQLFVPWIREAIFTGTDFYNDGITFLMCARDAVAIAERLVGFRDVG